MSIRASVRASLGLAIGLSFSGCAAPDDTPPFRSLESDHEHDGIHEGVTVREKASERVAWTSGRVAREPLEIKVLGFNDFHGQLSSGLRVGGRPVGSAPVLASYLHDAESRARDGAVIVHAGDHVGATPPASALLQDEPSIRFLDLLANEDCARECDDGVSSNHRGNPFCNLVGTLGNHEFDEGTVELRRLLEGGNHANGPFLEDPWRGTDVPYVSSNVVVEATGEPLLPPFTIKRFGRVPVAFIGAVLEETPSIVTPSGVEGIRFLDEADSINAAVARLRRLGVRAIVVTIHQGLRQATYSGPTKDSGFALTGAIVDIVKRLDSEVDVVVSGHAHGFTNALVSNDDGHPVLLTQAFSSGTAYAEIDLTIDRETRDIVSKSAVIVTTYADVGPGLVPDPEVASLVAAAEQRVAPLVSRIVGTVASDLTRAESEAGESALGNLIADAQRADTGARFAFMNPGGIRADLGAGEVTWGELFAIQPFGNDLVTMDLTGEQIRTLLEQQWSDPTRPRFLKTSGLRYTWSASGSAGSRIGAIVDASGVALEPTAVYRVVVNSFLASGGDNFVVLREGTNRIVGRVDLDALVSYVEGLPQPFSAAVEGRIARVP